MPIRTVARRNSGGRKGVVKVLPKAPKKVVKKSGHPTRRK